MRDERTFLWDMVRRARLALRFVEGKTREEFLGDRMLQEAVIRQITVIGEAAKKVTPEVRAKLPELPFSQMAKMRDIVIHVYWDVQLDIVWSTASRDLPPLVEAIESLIGPVSDDDPTPSP